MWTRAGHRSVTVTALAGLVALVTGLVAAGCAPSTDVVAERAEPVVDEPDEPGAPPGDERTGGGDGGDGGGGGGDDDDDGDIDGESVVPGWSAGDEHDHDHDRTGPVVLVDVDLAEVAEPGDGKEARPYDAFVAATIADVEAWMAELHPRLHGEPWEPLGGGIWPSYPGRDDLPGCGQSRTDPADVAEFVAFYCAGRDFIVYDDGPDSLLGELADEFGPVVMGVVIAHEYGHVGQDRLGVFDRDLPTILLEQQADCVSGAWVSRAASGRSSHVALSAADIRGALVALVAVRDPVGIDQFEPGGHGTAFDRIGAFQEGFVHGAERCDELLDDPLPLMPNEFQTTTDLLNDGDLPFGYGDGDIVPLVVGALNSYWSFQLEALGAGTFAPMTLVPVDDSADIGCSQRPEVVAPGLATCASDGTMYLDDATARDLYDAPIVGSADFAVGYFVGLAWADVAQDALGSELTGSERALANDCLVGAWTNDLDPDRPERPGETNRGVISPGDLDEAVIAAIEIGDAEAADDVLGVPFDKVEAFRAGVLGRIDACLERLDP